MCVFVCVFVSADIFELIFSEKVFSLETEMLPEVFVDQQKLSVLQAEEEPSCGEEAERLLGEQR